MSAGKNFIRIWTGALVLGAGIWILIFYIVRTAIASYLPQVVWAFDIIGVIYAVLIGAGLIAAFIFRDTFGPALEALVNFCWGLFFGNKKAV